MRRFPLIMILLLVTVMSVGAQTPTPTPAPWTMLHERFDHLSIVFGDALLNWGGHSGDFPVEYYLHGEILNKATGENLGEFPLNEIADDGTAVLYNGTVYFFVSDFNTGIVYARRLLSDPFQGEDSWSSSSDRRHSGGAVAVDEINGIVYFLSGRDELGQGHNLCTSFTLATETWLYLPELPISDTLVGRIYASARVNEFGQVVFSGGRTDDLLGNKEVHRSRYLYDPTTLSWTEISPMLTAREGHIDADGYLAAGAYFGEEATPTPEPAKEGDRPPSPPYVYVNDVEIDGSFLPDEISSRVGGIGILEDNKLLLIGGSGEVEIPPTEYIELEVEGRVARAVIIDDVPGAIGASLARDPQTGIFYWSGGEQDTGRGTRAVSNRVYAFSLDDPTETPSTGPIGLAILMGIFGGLIWATRRRH